MIWAFSWDVEGTKSLLQDLLFASLVITHALDDKYHVLFEC